MLLALTALIALSRFFFYYFTLCFFILPIFLTNLAQTDIFFVFRNLRAAGNKPVLKALPKLGKPSWSIELLIIVLFHFFLISGNGYPLYLSKRSLTARFWLLYDIFIKVVSQWLLFTIRLLIHWTGTHWTYYDRRSSNSTAEWKFLMWWGFSEPLLLIK